jgi:hypothetical protein
MKNSGRKDFLSERYHDVRKSFLGFPERMSYHILGTLHGRGETPRKYRNTNVLSISIRLPLRQVTTYVSTCIREGESHQRHVAPTRRRRTSALRQVGRNFTLASNLPDLLAYELSRLSCEGKCSGLQSRCGPFRVYRIISSCGVRVLVIFYQRAHKCNQELPANVQVVS